MDREKPDQFRIKEICAEAVRIEPYSLEFLPNQFKTRKMCVEAVRIEPYLLEYVFNQYREVQRGNAYKTSLIFLYSDHFKTQEVCIRAAEEDSWNLADVPDYFKTNEICDDAVCGDSYSLEFVPECYIKLQ